MNNIIRVIKTTIFSMCVIISPQILSDDSNSSDEVIRGLVKPVTSAVISSETSAQIEKLPFKSGDVFLKGDLLVKFNCALFAARHSSAQATLKGKQKSLENLKRLLTLNASSDVDVELAAIEVEKSRAELRAAAVLIRRCTIKAPYDGRVIDTHVNQYESVSEGQELISILNDKDLEIEVIIPSSWLVWMKVGIDFEFHIDEIQKNFTAKVTKIGATVDPVSQTISIKGMFTEEANVLAGMSGSAYFNQPK